MRRSTAVRVLAFLVSLSLGRGSVAAQAWDANLPALLDKLAENSWQPNLLAAFGTFTYADSALPSPFSRYLEEKLATALTKTKRLRLFNKAAAAAMDPAFRAIYGDFFSTNGVDALFSGRYFDEGSEVRAHFELTGLADGVLVGAMDLGVPKASIPREYGIVPSADAKLLASSLGGITSDDGGLKVSVSTERGAGAVYSVGERMRILVTVNRSAWIKVYHIDATGAIRLIWPNAFTSGRRIDPGALLRIPGPGDAFEFAMTPPFGTEFIKVVASTLPFSIDESEGLAAGSAFADLGAQDPRAVITRGIAVTASGKGERAEAMASYLIAPGSP